ncbi:DUF5682 family protein [Desulfogranum japonicum]|uniref:DUF5682 family protein n=1 Tax=Desulfogranum japonicum TaxID=231447 RepID=UPI000427034D|nr:DUF5682 family protein [Desulfogranum japonicum]
MSQAEIHYFGVRHHGPGSARRVLSALEHVRPATVLVEGPADCTPLFSQLARPEMKPPVALLSYVADNAVCSTFVPFVEYSPEYQACCWAVRNNAVLEFIDLPVATRLAQMVAEAAEQTEPSQEDTVEAEPVQEGEEERDFRLSADPIGVLAQLAGYEDGEAWWNDLIEQNADDDHAIFAILDQAMLELRSAALEQCGEHGDLVFARDLPREAHMRLTIGKAAKNSEGPVAVICGAWHVPALQEKHVAKDDRALLKTLPKKLTASKVKSTWVPWTTPRLATSSGYGAGVAAPMWYKHMWQQRNNPNALAYWLGGVARVMREQGHIVSTASVIEAVRLSNGLAAVRGRPAPGFEESRDAVIACLCFGEALIWRKMEARILLGSEVGAIPPDAPLVPLLEDLQRQQKKHKLKPEALPRELSLDLRSGAGAGKSVLLHRLHILDVPWGTLQDSGSSRGTFRERWQLCWEPEYAVRLVEQLIYGSTIEQAAAGKMLETIHTQHTLGLLAQTVQLCLAAQLDEAAERGIARLDERAALAGDCIEFLESLPPLVNISRYGTARDISLEHIDTLNVRLAAQAAIALPYACRNLSDEESQHYCRCVGAAHQAILLAEMEDDAVSSWWQALQEVVDTPTASLQVVGLCARLLYQEQRMAAEVLQVLFQKMLSPAIPAADAARFFEGFFDEAVQRLLYDDLLLNAVEQWLLRLDDEEFIEFLPLFRRMFSSLDAMERKRLLDIVAQDRALVKTDTAYTLNLDAGELWSAQLGRLGRLIKGEQQWYQ